MSSFFILQSQDVFTDARTSHQFDLARRLAMRGNQVTVMLVQNAVFAARLDAKPGALYPLIDGKVKILADDFSLEQREIDPSQLLASVTPCSIHVVIDALARGDKVIWN